MSLEKQKPMAVRMAYEELDTKFPINASSGRWEMSDWQPISTAPRDGSWLLLAHTNGRIMIGYVYPSGKLGDDIQIFDEPFSHWMPLPEPPQNKEKLPPPHVGEIFIPTKPQPFRLDWERLAVWLGIILSGIAGWIGIVYGIIRLWGKL